jgi:ABC-type branched-subunit amino acid transport system ATPase component/ABC-type branched-subunit amino acid transport system permease subunit
MAGKSTRSTRLLRLAAILLIGIAAWAATGPLKLTGEYYTFLVVAISYLAVVTMAVSMLAGFCGIWPIGHTAFTAIGAYMAVNLGAEGVPMEAIIVISIIVAGAVGYVLGMAAGRFSVLYFGLLTLALSLTAFELIGHWDQFTGGEQGIAVPPIPSILYQGNIGLSQAAGFCIIVATLAFLAVDLIVQGPIGRRWLAVKSQRTAAMAVGFVPPRENAIAFAISAALGAVSGVSMAVAMSYLDPEAFSLNAGVQMLVSTVVGGTGSLVGAVFGAAFIVLVPEFARGTNNVAPFVYGVTMMGVLLFLRKGVVPSLVEKLAGVRRGDRELELSAGQARDLAGLVADVLPVSGLALSIDDLSVQFGGVKALQNVSLDVPSGNVVGLIGPNGSGKTTLLNVLSGFYAATTVRGIKLGEGDLLALSPWQRMQAGFGRTFQHAELFAELTIGDMLRVVARQGVSARRKAGAKFVDPDMVAERIISGLGLEQAADSYPRELPFGIQKVSDIARAMAGGAGFLAMDEPFSGLDTEESTKLRQMLRELKAAGLTILIIDHAVHEIFDLADNIVVLDFGCVIARGKPEEIRNDPKVREAYFGLTESADTPLDKVARIEVPGVLPVLSAQDVQHRYGGVLALDKVSVDIGKGSFVSVLGANGAGKSTLAMILSGLMHPSAGKVAANGAPLNGSAREQRISLVPEGRRLFGQLSVHENLLLGGYAAGASRDEIATRLKAVAEGLPKAVRDDLGRAAATLSGGEQQMLAIGRALMAEPHTLIIDEPSMGLAPILIKQVYEQLAELHGKGVTILLMEQMATNAVRHSDRMIILDRGRVVYSGPPTGDEANAALVSGYIGKEAH